MNAVWGVTKKWDDKFALGIAGELGQISHLSVRHVKYEQVKPSLASPFMTLGLVNASERKAIRIRA
jgi:hypothetical protein